MLTSTDLAGQVLPYVRNAVHLAKNDIKADLKRWEWALIYPAWAIITGPLLEVITRIGIEITFALTRKKGTPLINGLVGFFEQMDEKYIPNETKQFLKDFRDLFTGASGQSHPAVVDTIAGKHCGEDNCLAFRQ